MPVQTLSVDTADGPRRADTPALAFRNHDHEGMTAVAVTITDETDTTVHEASYTLTPQVAWQTALSVEPGTYRVTATIAGNTATAECRIDADAAVMATIELGNGAISVADGA
ncbi:MAG: hypothetical protein J07HN6_00497 [Halonotius sp. J07HN6]|nr:MAG: hypothetical protein J07HN6_00497 [Halonotius sp. J07HN6]